MQLNIVTGQPRSESGCAYRTLLRLDSDGNSPWAAHLSSRLAGVPESLLSYYSCVVCNDVKKWMWDRWMSRCGSSAMRSVTRGWRWMSDAARRRSSTWPPSASTGASIFSPFHQIDIIGAAVIVWRVRGKIIRSVLCNIVCNNCPQCNAHTYEQT